ncbi:MAG TPA: outer membrane lipoprotein chaperone LolA [Burkholderiales bacterium]|nr:outer membrane lipoprotein chaperone LolA [Burkholderiales bacterium]
MRGLAGRVLLAAALSLAALAAHASALERFRAFVRSTPAASADFVQKVYDQNHKLEQESKGSFVFQRPGRFRWIYASPMPQLIVGDGERVWIYDQDLDQVTVRRMAHALGSTPAALLAGSQEVEQAFHLSEAGERGGLAWLEAKPREQEAGFSRILLGMGPEGVQAMELYDHFGQTTVLRFSNLVRNPKLDPRDFRFTPPKGADVLGEP